MQAFDSPLTNVNASYLRIPAPNGPGHTLLLSQMLVLPSRVSRSGCSRLLGPRLPKITRSGHDSQAPPPSVQTVGVRKSDQQRSVPTAPPVSSVTRNVHVPFTSGPTSPM